MIIKKVATRPAPVLFPVPTVLVTSQIEGGEPNMVTIAWTGIMCSEPPVVYIGVNPIRYSHSLIKESGEYVINIPTVTQVKEVDFCGVVSGKKVNKFKETGLTPVPASQVKAPLIAECPVNIECRVRQTLSLGSHDVFIADVVAIHYNEDVLDEKGRPDIERIQPYGFSLSEYRLLTDKIGFHGYSKKNKNR
ncbi:flavin reductase family protein [Paradesulfitobacterium ferrireducens]|uniref:flavin reductase family protein n=1 Tax=Paradesulfitobacterium ferrireducens TaxID=2816476 RepID=UPI001A8C980A|nr:flavin reductase family protein [Paradesulfitobacterium ferrireducens]